MAETPNFDFDFTGRIVEIGQTNEYGSSGFKKREFIVDNKDANGEYHNPVKFALVKDNCAKLDKFRVGQTIRVRGWFNGRAWFNEKKQITQYFTDIMAGFLDAVGGAAQENEPQTPAAEPANDTVSADGVVDMPF